MDVTQQCFKRGVSTAYEKEVWHDDGLNSGFDVFLGWKSIALGKQFI